MKVGLVLEGGAMRGMYTAAVLDVLMEEGVEFDLIVGVSAGALFGVNYLSGQKGRAIRYNKKFAGDPRYMGLLPLIMEGNIVSTGFAYHTVPFELDPFDDEKFQASPVPFYAVVTNVEDGNPEYIRITSVFEQMDTLRASGSMPLVSKPVTVDGKQYLDGGVSESIPYRWALEQGCDKVVVILTRDAGYRKEPMKPLLAKAYRKMPAIAERLLNRHNEYNESVEALQGLEEQGKAYVIRPSLPITIDRMEKDPDKLQSVYDLGIADAVSQLEELKAYLAS